LANVVYKLDLRRIYLIYQWTKAFGESSEKSLLIWILSFRIGYHDTCMAHSSILVPNCWVAFDVIPDWHKTLRPIFRSRCNLLEFPRIRIASIFIPLRRLTILFKTSKVLCVSFLGSRNPSCFPKWSLQNCLPTYTRHDGLYVDNKRMPRTYSYLRLIPSIQRRHNSWICIVRLDSLPTA